MTTLTERLAKMAELKEERETGASIRKHFEARHGKKPKTKPSGDYESVAVCVNMGFFRAGIEYAAAPDLFQLASDFAAENARLREAATELCDQIARDGYQNAKMEAVRKLRTVLADHSNGKKGE